MSPARVWLTLLFAQAQRGLRARTNGMPHLVGERRRHVGDLDVKYVFVVDLEDLRYQSGADRVGLAGVAIDFYPHAAPPSSVAFPSFPTLMSRPEPVGERQLGSWGNGTAD